MSTRSKNFKRPRDMKKLFIFLIIIDLVSAFFGCALIDKQLGKQIAQEYLEKGRQLENAGDLPGALEQYKLALTATPKNKELNNKIKNLEDTMRVIAETHYMQGLSHQQKGEYQLAQNEFLQVLRYNPNHQGALEMLKPPKPIDAEHYIVHKVKPNESLSKIAIIYYGDYKKFPIIAQFNNISDATKVSVGDLIKVPKLRGIPFLPPDKPSEEEKKVKKTAPPHEDIPSKIASEKPDTPPVEKKPATPVEPEVTEKEIKKPPIKTEDDSRDRGIEYFNKNKYSEAIIQLEKALSKNPNDEKTIHYLYLSYLQQAMVLYEKKDFLPAKNAFDRALSYNNDCEKCLTYSDKSEQEYKELHYNKGIAFFAKEQLTEAISEWELVTALDPDYKKVKENITKARQYLEKLKEIQKSSQQ